MPRAIDSLPTPKNPKDKVIVLSYGRCVSTPRPVHRHSSLPTPLSSFHLKVVTPQGRTDTDRNGTLGLYKAFQILGYNPYHLVTCFTQGKRDVRIVKEGMEARMDGTGEPYGRAEFDRWFPDNAVRLPSNPHHFPPP